jgi:hypothetical protein
MSTESNDLNRFEAALASLAPAAARVDRDRAMYLSGRAAAKAEAARPSGMRAWLWPASTAAMALVALSLGALLVQERHSRPVAASSPQPTAPREAHRNSNAAAAAESDAGSTAVAKNGGPRGANPIYLRIRNRVLNEGVDALPLNQTSEAGPALEPWTPRSHPLVSELLEG